MWRMFCLALPFLAATAATGLPRAVPCKELHVMQFELRNGSDWSFWGSHYGVQPAVLNTTAKTIRNAAPKPGFELATAELKELGMYILTEPMEGLTDPLYEFRYNVQPEVSPAQFRLYTVGEKNKEKYLAEENVEFMGTIGYVLKSYGGDYMFSEDLIETYIYWYKHIPALYKLFGNGRRSLFSDECPRKLGVGCLTSEFWLTPRATSYDAETGTCEIKPIPCKLNADQNRTLHTVLKAYKESSVDLMIVNMALDKYLNPGTTKFNTYIFPSKWYQGDACCSLEDNKLPVDIYKNYKNLACRVNYSFERIGNAKIYIFNV